MLKRILVAAALPLAVSTAAAQSPSPTGEARALWKSIIGNIDQAADELSESMYAYRPTPDVRSFGEMFAHIAGSQKMFCAIALGEKPPAEDAVEKSATTKAALVAALKESNDYCAKAYKQTDAAAAATVDLFGEKHSRMFTLLENVTHDNEHYGNIVTYLRMNHLVPPSSVPGSP